jgi:hypothetical protein
MFTRVSLVLAAVLATAATAAACLPPPLEELQPKKPAPAPFPLVGTVVALDGRDETIEYTVVVPTLVRKWFPLEPEPAGRLTITFGWEYQPITRKVRMSKLQFFDATGKRVRTEAAWKRLAIGANFFVSADNNPVSGDHLKLIARDVLVVVDSDNVILERLAHVLQIAGAVGGHGKSLPNPAPRVELR